MIKSKLAVLLLALFSFGCSKQAPSADSEDLAQHNNRDVNVAEAVQLIERNADLVILDIRTPEEYAQGHIEGALNIDYRGDGFQEKLATLAKDTPYLLHCHSGGRSGKTMKTLNKLGFTDIAHLKPGIQGWRAAGQPQITP